MRSLISFVMLIPGDMSTIEEKILESRPICPKCGSKIGYVVYDGRNEKDRWLCPNCNDLLFTNLDDAIRFFKDYNSIKMRLRREEFLRRSA
jgi:ribosomal protein S27AE